MRSDQWPAVNTGICRRMDETAVQAEALRRRVEHPQDKAEYGLVRRVLRQGLWSGRLFHRTQLLDCGLERAESVAIVHPGVALGQQRRHSADCEALGIEISFDLWPRERHRHCRTGPRAG